ncbi:cysteine hydrolase family protein [Roseibium sp. RKSG952]|uniref:cysteine hydrolase family protein n=1 Tax=Roseibium sp. RKSG952 TaxID=2529384 RepID=UPI0012BD3512|nr:isochorismatase family protein [Roseibium sp. RKSG952]MTH95274.1 isochorismatase family protein [Roseibium sp. RKSG952]
MLSAALNRMNAAILRRKTDSYRQYPSGKTAVIMVDAIPAYLADQDGLIRKIKQIMDFARHRGMPVIFSDFGGSRPARDLVPGVKRLFDLLEKADAEATTSAAFWHGESPLTHQRQSLSAFFDGTLATQLSKSGIEHVVLAGAFADLSGDSTARHASELGFHTTVLSDVFGATSKGAHAATLGITLPRLVHQVTTAESWQRDVLA